MTVTEMYIMATQFHIKKQVRFDESKRVAAIISEFKASMAKLLKLKGMLKLD